MAITLDAALDRIRVRAESDPAFADAVVGIAQGEVGDPFDHPDQTTLDLAQGLNRRRQISRHADLRGRSLTTPQVVTLLSSVSDRKGVDRRRKRGALLGIKVGRQTFHPIWQFDQRRRGTWDGLGDVLAALAGASADAIEVHAIATASGAATDGRSIAELLAAGEVDAAVQAAVLAGDQS